MDGPAAPRAARVERWLPYWAVFQTDLRQTLRSWVYRVWVLASLLAAAGYLLYRVGVYREAGMVQSASALISELLRWYVVAGVALVMVLAGGSISSERGILADSVLSRGISRYQYFLGKWHSRLVVVVGTFWALGVAAMVASFFFLHEDLTVGGSLLALVTVTIILAVVTTCGVAVSAVANSTVLGIAMLWLLLYGTGVATTILLPRYPTPGWALANLPQILKGYYDVHMVGRFMAWSVGGSLFVALLGLGYFSRRDV